jgi:hypothetical protein
MWSYQQTTSSTVATTSSGSTFSVSGFTQSFAGNPLGITSSCSTRTATAVFVSGQTSYTYRVASNTTVISTTTYESIHLTDSLIASTNVQAEATAATLLQYATSRTERSSRSSLTLSASLTSFKVGDTNWTLSSTVSSTVFTSQSAAGSQISITRSTSVVRIFGETTTSTFAHTSSSVAVSTFSTLSSVTTTSTWIESHTYSSSSSTVTTTANGQTTATATRSSTFLSSSTTTSTTGTSTVTYTQTTSSSSVDTVTTSSTTTESITAESYTTGTLALPCIIATVLEANTNEWAWRVTTTGSGKVESLGTSFTKTTYNATIDAGAVTAPTVSNTGQASATLTYTSTSTASSSLTSSRVTTTQSTYLVAQSGTLVPFTNTTRTATISHTRTTQTTYTYSTSATRTASFAYFSHTDATSTASFASTLTTTFSDGTSLSVLTFTRPTTTLIFFSNSILSTTNTFQTSGTIFLRTIVSASASITYVSQSSTSGGPPSVKAISVGEGWQAQSLGRLQAVGTNLAVGTTSTISAAATIWPAPVRAAIVSSSDAVALSGSVPTTLTNTKATSRIGGYGWDRTVGSTATQTIGMHRITTCNSSSSGTTEKMWEQSASTFSMTEGQAIAAESVPVAGSISSTNGDRQFLSFSAFPST